MSAKDEFFRKKALSPQKGPAVNLKKKFNATRFTLHVAALNELKTIIYIEISCMTVMLLIVHDKILIKKRNSTLINLSMKRNPNI